MAEAEELIEILCNQKPDLTKEYINEQIKIKKDKIGAGYLTDSGAVHLIAGDYGIKLEKPLKTEMKIKDLYGGAKEVSIEARVMNLSGPKEFSRKDGSPTTLRTMTVYDTDATASVRLWNDQAKLAVIDNLKPGDLVKIIKAYVKADIDGSPTINMGDGSSIELVNSESDIQSIDKIVKDISDVKEGDKNIAIFGTNDGEIKGIKFTTTKGRQGKALKMKLKGGQGNTTGVVIWGKDESDIPNIVAKDARVELFGVRVKQGNMGLEVHGDDATIINVEGSKDSEPITVRVLTIVQRDDRDVILAVDKNESLYNITDYARQASFEEGDIIDCMPSKAYGSAITIDVDSLVRKLDDDGSIPNIDKLRTRIQDVKINGTYCVEGIILKPPEMREIQTKNGETVSLAEAFIEDESKSIWIKGWRDVAREITKFESGDIVQIIGANAKAGPDGSLELMLNHFSKIMKKSTSPKSLDS